MSKTWYLCNAQKVIKNICVGRQLHTMLNFRYITETQEAGATNVQS